MTFNSLFYGKLAKRLIYCDKGIHHFISLQFSYDRIIAIYENESYRNDG